MVLLKSTLARFAFPLTLSSGVTIPGHVPEQDISAQYMSASNQALITIANDPGTFSLSDVGYLVTNTPFALAPLNRATRPPGAFIASGVPDGTTLGPGGSASFLISGVNPGQYVTVFSDAQWSGASSGNFDQQQSGTSFEFQSVPEPASWVLAVIGIGGILAGRGVRSSLGKPRTALIEYLNTHRHDRHPETEGTRS